MKKTVGSPDRAVRVVLAIGAAAGAGVVGFATVGGIVLLVVAAVMIVTAMSSMCPLYSLFRISTRPRRADSVAPSGPVHRRVA
jgi:hypothetical protein